MKFFKSLFSISLLMGSLGFANDHCEERYPCENLYVTADYLYWKAHVDQLEYAIDGINFPASSGETRELNWNWDSGFKAGIGYIFSGCGWDIYLNYTRFHTKAKDSSSPEPGTILNATYSYPFLFEIFFASAEFDLNYNTLDLELKNVFCVTPCFLLSPSFGLRGAWTKDKYDIFYVGFLDNQNLHLKESFHGIGPRIGLNGVWNFCGGFSLFGEGEYALLWGRNRSSFFSATSTAIAADTKQTYYTLRHLTDIKVGLGWDYCFCRSRLALQLAWEQRLWLDYNQYLHFTDTENLHYMPNSSALSLYGLTLTARYFF